MPLGEKQAPAGPLFELRRLGVTEHRHATSFALSDVRLGSDSRTALLQGLMIGAIVIGGLYIGREVLLPLALAILLSFVLTPLLLLLRKVKVPRVPAVIVVVTLAFGIIFDLAGCCRTRLRNLRATCPLSARARRQDLGFTQIGGVVRHLRQHRRRAQGARRRNRPKGSSIAREPRCERGPGRKGSRQAHPVEIRRPEPRAFEILQSVLGTVLPPLATAGIVILFVIFILLQREDLRDRLVRLMGATDMQRTTATMNDAATRLSGYFLRQVLINSAYGTFIAFGLWAIGVPSPSCGASSPC